MAAQAKARNFNPRSREGSDEWEANADAARQDFNPRSREGSDLLGFYGGDRYNLFQSTLP